MISSLFLTRLSRARRRISILGCQRSVHLVLVVPAQIWLNVDGLSWGSITWKIFAIVTPGRLTSLSGSDIDAIVCDECSLGGGEDCIS